MGTRVLQYLRHLSPSLNLKAKNKSLRSRCPHVRRLSSPHTEYQHILPNMSESITIRLKCHNALEKEDGSVVVDQPCWFMDHLGDATTNTQACDALGISETASDWPRLIFKPTNEYKVPLGTGIIQADGSDFAVSFRPLPTGDGSDWRFRSTTGSKEGCMVMETIKGQSLTTAPPSSGVGSGEANLPLRTRARGRPCFYK